MRAPAGIELLSDGTWDCGSTAGEWSPGGCGCRPGAACECGGSCGCEGEGGSCGGKPTGGSGEVPHLPDYNGEIWASEVRSAHEWDSVWATHLARGEMTTAEPWPWTIPNMMAGWPIDPPDGWFLTVPVCPCDVETLKAMKAKGVEVSQDPPVALDLHWPATECYRIWYATDVAGNQCCFDENGKLITHGSGAGTPDRYNPRFLLHHFMFDVLPFSKMGWEEYHRRGWAPISEDCPKNTGKPGHPAGGFPGRPPRPPNPWRPPRHRSPEEIWEQIERDFWNECTNRMMQEFFGPSESAFAYRDQCYEDCLDFWAGA